MNRLARVRYTAVSLLVGLFLALGCSSKVSGGPTNGTQSGVTEGGGQNTAANGDATTIAIAETLRWRTFGGPGSNRHHQSTGGTGLTAGTSGGSGGSGSGTGGSGGTQAATGGATGASGTGGTLASTGGSTSSGGSGQQATGGVTSTGGTMSTGGMPGQSGSGGSTQTGGPVAFPVVASSNARYLVDHNGAPFPILGRASWFVISLTVDQYTTYLNDTLSRGYNAIEVTILDHDPRGNNAPFDGNGDLPFLKRLDGSSWDGTPTSTSSAMPDFTTPNEAYWSYVDSFLAYCNQHGILVLMFPAYVGYAGGDQGWMQEMVANGATKMQTYGAWIGNRYRNQPNLVWMMGGDMGTGSNSFSSQQTSAENGLVKGLKSVTSPQSTNYSAEWNSESIATDQTTFGSAMTLNGAYSFGGDVSNQARRAYSASPVMPAFLLEEPYDQEGPDGNNVNPSATQPVRRFQWWGWLSAIGGYMSGNGYVWPFDSGWQNHLDTQGSRDMSRLNQFVTSIAWSELVPSGLGGAKTLVTSGGGSAANDPSYITAAATPSGTLLVAYVPPAHSGSFTVDMTALSGTAQARWFDPTNAAYTSIGSFPNTGTHAFTTPGKNSAGDPDWVLVIQKQ